MFTWLKFILFLTAFPFLYCQKCRYVTVPICDEGIGSAPSSGLAIKGEKGQQGPGGKRGAAGARGEQGIKGDKGERGRASGVEELQNQLTKRLDAMQSLITNLSLPWNCESSPIQGYQKLRSGEMSYCDGGWTVFQKRFFGKVNFQRNWNDYKNGFGNFSTDFWLGLEKVHQATFRRGCRLRVDLWSFDGDHAFAEYSDFSIESERDNYRLHIGGYSGTAGDSFNYHDKAPFTTIDRDNDRYGGNCAKEPHGVSGGWWFNSCLRSQLNAAWGKSAGSWHNNIWNTWKGFKEALNGSIMKFRCN